MASDERHSIPRVAFSRGCRIKEWCHRSDANYAHRWTPVADPETNVRLAGKLLRQIEKTLKLHPSTSQNDRISIILACYNGGVGHVADARRLAKSNGEDPNSWEVVARYLKLKADPAIYQSDLVRHGRFTGSRQTIAYVREVIERYDHYRLVVDHNDALMAQDASRVMRDLKSFAR